MGKGLLTVAMTTCVGLVAPVDKNVLPSVTGVSKAPVTVRKVTLEWLLSCNKTKKTSQ